MTSLAWLLLLTAAPGQIDDPSRVIVRMIDAPIVSGVIVSWQSTGELVLRLDNGESRRLTTAEIDEIEFDRRVTINSRATWEVRLTDGSRFPADIMQGDDRALELQSACCGSFTIALEELRAIRSRDTLRSPIPAPLDEDQLLLREGRVIHGGWVRCDAERLDFQEDALERAIPWKNVLCVIPAMNRPSAEPGLRLAIHLTDGSCLVAESLNYRPSRFELKSTAFGQHVIEGASVRGVEVLGTRRLWLGELSPVSFQHTPYMADEWPMRIDAAADGSPLRLAGREYSRGLGLHSQSRVVWRLDDMYVRFTAEVGLDDSAGPLGDADLTILVDARPALEHRGLKKGQSPRRVDVELHGAREMTIDVGFGKGGDVQDRVSLVRAALVKKRSSASP